MEFISASYLLYSGQWIIQALMEPVLAQLQLRNLFEVTFANTERATQAEQWLFLFSPRSGANNFGILHT